MTTKYTLAAQADRLGLTIAETHQLRKEGVVVAPWSTEMVEDSNVVELEAEAEKPRKSAFRGCTGLSDLELVERMQWLLTAAWTIRAILEKRGLSVDQDLKVHSADDVPDVRAEVRAVGRMYEARGDRSLWDQPEPPWLNNAG